MTRFFALIAVLTLFSDSAWSAASVLGTWRLTTTTQVKVTVLDQTLGYPTAKSAAVKGAEFATFEGDWSYTGTDWLNRLQIYLLDANSVAYVQHFDAKGQWKYKSAGRYLMDYDRYVLDFADRDRNKFNAPFFNRIAAEALLQKPLGYVPENPRTLLTSFTDNGTVKKNGKLLQGVKNAQFYLFWNDPVVTDKVLQAFVDVTIRYTGKPYTVSSQCCLPKSADTTQNQANAAQNATDSAAFLSATETQPGVQKTTSGLLYLPLQEGSGDPPAATDQVVVNYRGFFPSGTVFDVGTLATFNLDQTVKEAAIAGWADALPLMHPGSKYRLYIPSDLAYKQAGRGSIGPNAALVFDVELVKVIKATP